MQGALSIGDLAGAAGVPVSTVRYYERIGLLRPEGRTRANYRVYGEASLEQLKFIRAAQATGFALDDIVPLIEIQNGSRDPCAEVQELIHLRLATVEQRLEDLKRLDRVLKGALRQCREANRAESCKILDGLSETKSVSPRTKRPSRKKSS